MDKYIDRKDMKVKRLMDPHHRYGPKHKELFKAVYHLRRLLAVRNQELVIRHESGEVFPISTRQLFTLLSRVNKPECEEGLHDYISGIVDSAGETCADLFVEAYQNAVQQQTLREPQHE